MLPFKASFLEDLNKSVDDIILAGKQSFPPAKNIQTYWLDLAKPRAIDDLFLFLKRCYQKIDLIFLDVGLKSMSLADSAKEAIDYNVYGVLNVVYSFLKNLGQDKTSTLLITYSIGDHIVGPKLQSYPALPFVSYYLRRYLGNQEQGIQVEFLSPEMFFKGRLK